MTKHTLFNALNQKLDESTPYIVKFLVGDSTNNHRTPSVRQVIRFFRTFNGSYYRSLANKLETVYSLIKDEMRDYRKAHNNRSDAYDFSEFRAILGYYIVTEQKAKFIDDNL